MNTDPTSPVVTLVILGAALIGIGTYLMLERSLTRIVLGVGFTGNGINILFLVAGGEAGRPPLSYPENAEGMADPLPQIFMLTAIVITLGTVAFLIAMAYRTWQLNGNDEVQDDLEDSKLARRAERLLVESRHLDDMESTLEQEAEETVDETSTDLSAIGTDLADENREGQS